MGRCGPLRRTKRFIQSQNGTVLLPLPWGEGRGDGEGTIAVVEVSKT
jgi:hypothetical protein